ncbi:MAG: hypothetical protein CL558_11615 [Alphaproteobacteria bacterium]|nr:hypothetical protein [Alphaproteobacteria bacterium]MAS46161.1 hypothetical protein [Alphaproteobacteria bacterium]MAX95655.1 hypothetical protein [Alphaproteobacteria bacterium]MBN54209.1 hypothetical protein [Alphaproteobacteria bacterium]OUT42216.1 MAG: hypothetical protein CBB62_07970 [Micavibrio sp. TMED2]|tara:strand:+ start:3323 stop:3523 length:201 start_codon:yes stop_codon:yes gene_type:complete
MFIDLRQLVVNSEELAALEGVREIAHTPKSKYRGHFKSTSYIHHQNGQEYEMYEMDRTGFAMLGSG